MVDLIDGAVDAVTGAISKPFTDAMGNLNITQKLNDAVQEQLRASGIIEKLQAFAGNIIHSAIAFAKPFMDWAMKWVEVAATKIADIAGFAPQTDLKLIATDTTAINAPQTPDKAGMAKIVEASLASQGSGLARLGSGIGSTVSKGLSSVLSMVSTPAHAADGSETAKKHADQARTIATATYIAFEDKTYESLITKALNGRTVSDTQRQTMIDALKKDTVAQRFAQAEAESWSGVNKNGEVVGAHGYYGAVLTSLTTAKQSNLQIPDHGVQVDPVLAAASSTIQFELKKTAAVEQFKAIPASIQKEIQADQGQYKLIINAILDGKTITPETLSKLSKLSDKSAAALAASLTGNRVTPEDKVLAGEMGKINSIEFSADGKTLQAVLDNNSIFPLLKGVEYSQTATVAVSSTIPSAQPAPAAATRAN